VNDHFIYWANGVLVMLYALWHIRYVVVGLILAFIILNQYGAEQARTAYVSAGRYGREHVGSAAPSFWTSRLFAVALWTLGMLLAPTDIEGIWSLIMWAALLIALRALPEERAALLFRHLWLMAIYGVLMVILRFLVGDSLNITQLTHVLHLGGDSAVLLDATRSSILPVAGLFIWVVFPAFLYMGSLIQRFQLIRGALSARGRPQDVIAGLSHRGEGRATSPRPPIEE
jgi:hypothetical protein